MRRVVYAFTAPILFCLIPALAGQTTGAGAPDANSQALRLPRYSPQPDFRNSAKVRELIRAGNLYLSVSDAITLAIENNLDVELSRFNIAAAAAELTRAKGGGVLRNLNYNILEAPAGV